MQDLIFLGQVPLTNFYINFWQWLVFALLLLVVLAFVATAKYRKHLLAQKRRTLIVSITL
jgi:hypothetical protein